MFNTKKAAVLGIAVSIALFAGCASMSDQESRYSHKEGWRKGTVIDIGSGLSFAERLPRECKTNSVISAAWQRFATVHYRYTSRDYWHTTPIPDNSPLKVGEPVFVNTSSCTDAIVARHLPFEKKTPLIEDKESANP